jgi:hypothetical protein
MGNVLDLVSGCEPAAAEALQEVALLTPFAVEVRYPSDSPEFLSGEETRAVEIARRVHDVVNDLMQAYLSAS